MDGRERTQRASADAAQHSTTPPQSNCDLNRLTMMIEPLLRDDALLADVAAVEPGEGFALWWLGQSGFLLKHAGRHLLFDPYLSDSLAAKYAGTDKPHERMTRCPIDPARLGFVDAVTASHPHTDHLDPATLGPLRAANPALRLVVPEAARGAVAERLGCEPAWPIGLDDGRDATVGPFTIRGVPAAHEDLERDASGRCRFLGYVVRCGRFSIYHAGDTVRYEGMAERLRPFAVDVALLPINGRSPQRGVPGNLWGDEAAELARDMDARLAVPCHFDMFAFNTATPEAFVAAGERLGQPYRVLRCGERFPSDELPSRLR